MNNNSTILLPLTRMTPAARAHPVTPGQALQAKSHSGSGWQAPTLSRNRLSSRLSLAAAGPGVPRLSEAQLSAQAFSEDLDSRTLT
eukprot:2331043-Rhodomonas_salina.1